MTLAEQVEALEKRLAEMDADQALMKECVCTLVRQLEAAWEQERTAPLELPSRERIEAAIERALYPNGRPTLEERARKAVHEYLNPDPELRAAIERAFEEEKAAKGGEPK